MKAKTPQTEPAMTRVTGPAQRVAMMLIYSFVTAGYTNGGTPVASAAPATALKCANCTVTALEHCKGVQTCAKGELCYVALIQGTLLNYFTAGCGPSKERCIQQPKVEGGFHLHSPIPSAQECCHSDMCNLTPGSAHHASTIAHLTTTHGVLPTKKASQASTIAHLTTTQGVLPTQKATEPPTTVEPFRLSKGLECKVCTGGSCGLDDDPVTQCPAGFPYCMSSVQNDNNGNKYVTKSCASANECNIRWWHLSSKRSVCTNYDPAEIYVKALSCTYCCQTTLCNQQIVPPKETQFIGTGM